MAGGIKKVDISNSSYLRTIVLIHSSEYFQMIIRKNTISCTHGNFMSLLLLFHFYRVSQKNLIAFIFKIAA